MIKRQNISYLVPVTLRSLHYFASPLLLPDYKRSIGGTHMQISLLVCRLKGLVLGSQPCSKSLCRHFSWNMSPRLNQRSNWSVPATIP